VNVVVFAVVMIYNCSKTYEFWIIFYRVRLQNIASSENIDRFCSFQWEYWSLLQLRVKILIASANNKIFYAFLSHPHQYMCL